MKDVMKMIKGEADDIFTLCNGSLIELVPAKEVDRIKAIIKLKLNIIYTQGRIDGMSSSTTTSREKEEGVYLGPLTPKGERDEPTL